MWKTVASVDSYNYNNTSPSSVSSPMPSSGSNNGDTSCQLQSRKKRRGMIEKKRRDRINHSLNELRRLVPAAFEKQGSAKLEKAEILQMTVEHLRGLHAKGFDALSFDPQKFAMDYHSLGFRECASEVARYLGAEGMDTQDPLRIRLMSHLQCYATQRELSLKASAAHSSWNPSAFTTPLQFTPSHLTPQHNPSSGSISSDGMSIPVSTHYNSSHLSATLSDSGSILGGTSYMMPPPPAPPAASLLHKTSNSPPPLSANYTSSAPQTMSSHPHAHHSHQYLTAPYGSPIPGPHAVNAHGVKYRPWNELAY